MRAEERIGKELKNAHIILPREVEERIADAYGKESSPGGRIALKAIIDNIGIAREKHIPLCQDTGMFWCMVEIGRDCNISIARIENAIESGAMSASLEGFYRKSVVKDPIYKRENTRTNLPPVINYTLIDGDRIIVSFLLKGFGSENCSSVRMLNPTVGEDGVVDAVVDIMKKAGGKPCPPTFIGVGVGGTMDRAAFLSKKAFFKKEEETPLENRIKEEINKLGIGPGGLGGISSCLSVQMLTEPTHIAGLPVAVTVNCWADRKARMIFGEGDFK